MQKVILFILVICFALSLYSFCFHPGKVLSFEKAYTNAMEFATTTGNIFAKAKDTVTNGIHTVLSLPAQISEFFENFVKTLGDALAKVTERIRQFFANLLDSFFKFFRKDGQTECTCEDPDSCTDCGCIADDCICGWSPVENPKGPIL